MRPAVRFTHSKGLEVIPEVGVHLFSVSVPIRFVVRSTLLSVLLAVVLLIRPDPLPLVLQVILTPPPVLLSEPVPVLAAVLPFLYKVALSAIHLQTIQPQKAAIKRTSALHLFTTGTSLTWAITAINGVFDQLSDLLTNHRRISTHRDEI